jgi:hypothetical protein
MTYSVVVGSWSWFFDTLKLATDFAGTIGFEIEWHIWHNGSTYIGGGKNVQILGSSSNVDPWGLPPAGWLWGSGGGPPPIDQLPSGGGGGNTSTASAAPETDCEKYAIALAQSAAVFRTNHPFSGSVRFGADLYNRAITGIQYSSFGLAPTYSGFNYDLVKGGQNSGVYRHVSASVGISLAAGGGLGGMIFPAARTLLVDLPNYLKTGNLENLAEMQGNAAGMQLVPAFNRFFSHGQSGLLVSEIMRILCDK